MRFYNNESALDQSEIYYIGLVPPWPYIWLSRLANWGSKKKCVNVLLHCLTIYCLCWKLTKVKFQIKIWRPQNKPKVATILPVERVHWSKKSYSCGNFFLRSHCCLKGTFFQWSESLCSILRWMSLASCEPIMPVTMVTQRGVSQAIAAAE